MIGTLNGALGNRKPTLAWHAEDSWGSCRRTAGAPWPGRRGQVVGAMLAILNVSLLLVWLVAEAVPLIAERLALIDTERQAGRRSE